MSEMHPWIATYRIQLSPNFGFDAAAGIVDYLANLGISHLYLSPIFEARPGSTHGYDQTDPTRIRSELGGEPAFSRLADAARNAGLAILLDIVPNHMAAHHDNPWWFELLRHGRQSRYDRFFDVDWASAAGRIVLPVLGAPRSEVIRKGELSIEPAAAGGHCLRYFDNLYPLRADLPVPTGAPTGDDLEELLSRQHFELTFWRDGLRRINYRRFFDISDLVGVRVEDRSVFDELHVKVIDLVARRQIAGVRIDHVDGLRDPLRYLTRLRSALDAAGPRIPIFVEKIIARDEHIPYAWPVDGTTGYEFLAASTMLMTDAAGVAKLRRAAEASGAGAKDFGELATACKREVAESVLEPELSRICRVAQGCLRAAGEVHEAVALRKAMLELSSCLAVYRTYADEAGIADHDANRVRFAARRAAAHVPPGPASRALERLTDLLTLSGLFHDGSLRASALEVLLKWQQFTGPLAAKGVEDTALYRDMACPALNDVGTEPVEGEVPALVLQCLAAHRRARPLSLNATDTHDAKRSEDVRARLAALTHFPDDWTPLHDHAVARLWAASSRPGARPPTVQVLSLLVHSAFALWPDAGDPNRELADRLQAYIVKAAREAKQTTSWTEPASAYEDDCRLACTLLLFAEPLADVRARIVDLAHATRPLAARFSVAALMLKALFPGTPDFYQGSECRTLSLVDPDNRRPVDFAMRRRLLESAQARWRADPAMAASECLRDPGSDAARVLIVWRALVVRRQLLGERAPVILESCDASSSRWRWVVSGGGRRCLVTVNLRPAAEGRSRHGRPADPQGADQLAAQAPGGPESWVSIVADGIHSLW